MRDIKFRGKNPESGKWVHGDLYHALDFDSRTRRSLLTDGLIIAQGHQEEDGVVVHSIDVDASTVGEFTGMHDKNGREIYEGDIVRYVSGKRLDKNGKWVDYTHDITVSYLGARYNISTLSLLEAYMEVVGNIHDNTAGVSQASEGERQNGRKFKVGDFVISDNSHRILMVLAVNHDSYYCEYIITGGHVDLFFDLEEQYHLWSIRDARDGDVLVAYHPKGSEVEYSIFLFKEIRDRDYVKDAVEFHCRVCDGSFYLQKNGYMGKADDNFAPANVKQSQLLFDKMKEAGYEWDDRKNELRKATFDYTNATIPQKDFAVQKFEPIEFNAKIRELFGFWRENELDEKAKELLAVACKSIVAELEDILYRRYSDDGDPNQRWIDLKKYVEKLKKGEL